MGRGGDSSTSFFPLASLIQNSPLSVPMPSTEPSWSFDGSASPVPYTENLIEEEPLFKTNIESPP